jgi:lipid-binding SYLF domain-containing protein
MGIGATGRGFRWILSAQAVDVVPSFGTAVIGFKIAVPEGPFGRDAIHMNYLFKIPFP